MAENTGMGNPEDVKEEKAADTDPGTVAGTEAEAPEAAVKSEKKKSAKSSGKKGTASGSKKDAKAATEETAGKKAAASEVPKGHVKIKIPVDPLNPGIDKVSVTINNKKYEIPRGETTTVPEGVVTILEDAGYL